MDTTNGAASGERTSRPSVGRTRDVYASLGVKRGHRFDYKDLGRLKYFIGPQGKVVPRRISGLSARDQRSMVAAVNRARQIALLPLSGGESR